MKTCENKTQRFITSSLSTLFFKLALKFSAEKSLSKQQQMLIDEIKKVLPQANIKYIEKNDDPRDYRVNSDKIKRTTVREHVC